MQYAAIDRDAENVEAAFLDAALPDDVRDAIADAYRFAARGGRVSVRSSATAEDRATAGFAGQYSSFLDVEAVDVERAVRLCWASLWSPAARAYRHAEGIDESDLAMAVIVQEMIEVRTRNTTLSRTTRPGHLHGLRRTRSRQRITPTR